MRKFAAALVLLAGALSTIPGSADAPADKTVVVTVGDQSVTVAALQQRMDKIPLFQLRTFGKTPDEIRHGFVDKVIVPELLLAAEAKRRKLDETPTVQDRLKAIRRSAMTEALADEAKPIDDAEIAAYYAENAARFNTPERLRIWRILVADKSDAEKIVKQAQGIQGPEHWDQLAREKSLDKATGMRQGNLGFVRPDGQTEQPRVRVDPALYDAAAHVKDGQVVPEPVKEGDNWAVVWRRGSMPAVHRSVDQEKRSIRQILTREQTKDALAKLMTKLRKERVSDVNEKLLDYVEVNSFGDVASKARPGVVPRQRHRGSPTPKATERGYR